MLRFLGGVALGGVHMPGLKLLAERTAGRARARGSAVYAACYTLGAAGSFFIAGAVDAALGWRGAFAVSGLAPLFAIGAVALLPVPSETAPAAEFTFDLRPLLRNRALMAYVLAFAGNIWEVSVIRAWFVPISPGCWPCRTTTCMSRGRPISPGSSASARSWCSSRLLRSRAVPAS